VAEETILQFLETSYQLEPPIPRVTRTDIQTAINHLNPKKSPGYDLITSKILKELPIIGTKYITQLFDVILLLNYFPTQWKVAQISSTLSQGSLPTLYPPADQSVSCPLYPYCLRSCSSNGSFHSSSTRN
jgi:hypothetical protein